MVNCQILLYPSGTIICCFSVMLKHKWPTMLCVIILGVAGVAGGREEGGPCGVHFFEMVRAQNIGFKKRKERRRNSFLE